MLLSTFQMLSAGEDIQISIHQRYKASQQFPKLHKFICERKKIYTFYLA